MSKTPAKTRKAKGPAQTPATRKRKAPRVEVANAAIHFAMDAYDTSRPKLMGRHAAGEGFLTSFARHGIADELYCFAKSHKDFTAFNDVTRGHGNRRPSIWVPYHEPDKLAEVGCLFTPDPNITRYAWTRRHHDQRAYSLVGVFHTKASHGVMAEVANYLSAPVQPWDATICPTRAVRAKVERLLEWQAEYLEERIGGKVGLTHQLPVIPLGVDCSLFDPRTKKAQDTRKVIRERFGAGEDDIVALFVGRLAFHAKANPIPMYMGLEQAAKRTGKRIILVLSGWFGSDTVRDQFSTAAKILAPSIKVVSVDGRKPDVRFNIWHAADIFATMPDNIQETFGLTPIEAMAAGLPVVGSEWDGYRDTVRHGVDGMLVPTLMAAPGDGEDLAFRHDAGVDDYDHYVGTSAQFVSVDPGKAADAFTALIENPDLRRKMGEAGRQRAETTFDWKVIVGQYQELWAELKGRRTKARVTAPRGETSQANPSRGDPFALFEHYPTRIIDKDVVFEDGPVSLHDAMRLGYMGRLNGSLNAPEVDIHAVLDHLAENGATTTGALLDLVPADRRPGLRRTLVWLAKLGVIVPHW